MSEPTRREALVTIAGLGAAVSAAAQTPAGIFTAPERASVTALVDAIIPRTDTPGASDAGAVLFIERRLAANAPLLERFRSGLGALESEAKQKFGSTFAALSNQQQSDLLTPASKDSSTPAGAFFKLAKDLTVDGYYTSKDGLTKELGWHGNTFLTEFTGCTHTEHQG